MRNAAPPAISVIVNTYQNPRGLALVLAGLIRQELRPQEIIVADDGSTDETADVIKRFAQKASCPICHVWHPHEGFRKWQILNRAIIEAKGPYVVFFDGDCVPRSSCLRRHARLAYPSRYVTGGILRLQAAYSDKLTPEDVERGILEHQPLWASHLDKPHRLLVSRIPILRDLMDRVVRRNPGWRGGNASTFKENLLRVGGFDERFSYGYEDADLGHRLFTLGIQGRSIRYSEPVFHVEHARSYVSDEVIQKNYQLYLANRRACAGRTPYGIPEDPNQYPKDYEVVRYDGSVQRQS